MRADKKYIAFVYNTVTGTHRWSTFDTYDKAVRWCGSMKKRIKMKHFSADIIHYTIHSSLTGVMARMRDGFSWESRGLAMAMHACACHFTGKQYPIPTIDNPFAMSVC